MRRISLIFIVVNLVALLGFFGFKTWQKEQILTDGRLVLLRLAPVDPRSLMQGDYMVLRYDGLGNEYIEGVFEGYVVVRVSTDGVGQLNRLVESNDGEGLAGDEILLRYKANDYGEMSIGAESYFFEEGQAKSFESAVYGGLRVDGRGNSVLVGLYDENRQLIIPSEDENQELVDEGSELMISVDDEPELVISSVDEDLE